MTSKEIENNVAQIIQNFSQEEFIYDLLLAYGISKTSITRLKKFVYYLDRSLRLLHQNPCKRPLFPAARHAEAHGTDLAYSTVRPHS